MRKNDIIACSLLVSLGMVWFVAAEVVYDGSLMEDPFLRSGMLALWYVPLAAMYLVKAAKGESRKIAVFAWLLAFLTMLAMTTADVLVTHYKPNSDHCCIPVGEDFALGAFGALVSSGLFSISDVLVMRCVRKIVHPMARQWFVRRAMRLCGTILLVVLLFCLLNVAFGVIGVLKNALG